MQNDVSRVQVMVYGYIRNLNQYKTEIIPLNIIIICCNYLGDNNLSSPSLLPYHIYCTTRIELTVYGYINKYDKVFSIITPYGIKLLCSEYFGYNLCCIVFKTKIKLKNNAILYNDFNIEDFRDFVSTQQVYSLISNDRYLKVLHLIILNA